MKVLHLISILSLFSIFKFERVVFDSYEHSVGICPPTEDGIPETCFEFDRFYIDKTDNKCKPFLYKGFGGTMNNFATMEQCEAHLNVSPLEKLLGCHETKSVVGLCDSANSVTKWSYNKNDGGCDSFQYTGCGGNNNRYDSELECKQVCQNNENSERPSDMSDNDENKVPNVFDCSVPPVINSEEPPVGIIADKLRRRCVYGAIATSDSGKKVRGSFKDFNECVATDNDKIPGCRKTTPDQFERTHNLQNHNVAIHYYFDKSDKKCKPFESSIGDFDYNLNNFASELLCHSYCGGELETIKDAEEICLLPKASEYNQDNSTGNLNLARFYYDSASKTCQSFQYGGIGGNGNNFYSRQLCENVCKNTFGDT